ncbi:MAG: hypothetical protein NTV69_05600 [Caldilinea sp.]|nr:hypothetical protein [Caldilinea sp.]
MDAFLSFHAPGFWGVLALLTGMVVFGLRPLVPHPARAPLVHAYWVLLPFCALVLGGVSPRWMGLFYMDWETSLRLGSSYLLVIAALAATARLFWGPAGEGAAPAPLRSVVSLAAAVGTVGAEEFFWGFLRSLLTELLLRQGMEASAYWALWLAALLALPALWLVRTKPSPTITANSASEITIRWRRSRITNPYSFFQSTSWEERWGPAGSAGSGSTLLCSKFCSLCL